MIMNDADRAQNRGTGTPELFPPGPALLFVRSGRQLGAESAIWVDRGLPQEGGPVSFADNRRDLRLLRALCEHVIELLDEEGVR